MSAAPSSYGPRPGSLRPKILIVDDSKPTARALSVLLTNARYDTAIAFRGADALETARTGGPFAAAIVDIHLPDISGLLVSQQLREFVGPDMPIIVLSGDTSMQTLNSLPHVGATYFYSKPVNSTQLLERLREWVDGKSQNDGQVQK